MNFLFLQHTLTNNFTRGNNNQITENHEAQVSVNTHRHTHTHTHTHTTTTTEEMRSSSVSTFHCQLQRSLEWMGRANDLASQVTIPHTNALLPMGTH